jgi:hypothetical protein
MVQARATLERAPIKRDWAVVIGLGILILVIVGAFGYFPRLNGANDVIGDFKPVFEQQRVDSAVAGAEFVHETVLFGDPIATTAGGAVAQYRRLMSFVGERSALTESQVRRAVRRVAPSIAALLEAVPLSRIASEVPRLLAYLSKKLKLPGDRLRAALEKRVPGLAQSIQAVVPVGLGWNAIPGTADLTRFDGLTAVRTLPAFDQYVRQDLLRVVSDQRDNFERLASSWPPVNLLPTLLAMIGALVTLYGLVMMRVSRRRP